MYDNYKIIGLIENEENKAYLLKDKNKSEFFVGINEKVADVTFYNLNDCYNYANEKLDIMPDIRNIDMFKNNLKEINNIISKIIQDFNNPLFYIKMLQKVKINKKLGESSLKILNNKEHFIKSMNDIILLSNSLLKKDDNFSAKDFCDLSEELMIRNDSILNKDKIHIIQTLYPELGNRLNGLLKSLHEDTILGYNGNNKISVKHLS